MRFMQISSSPHMCVTHCVWQSCTVSSHGASGPSGVVRLLSICAEIDPMRDHPRDRRSVARPIVHRFRGLRGSSDFPWEKPMSRDPLARHIIFLGTTSRLNFVRRGHLGLMDPLYLRPMSVWSWNAACYRKEQNHGFLEPLGCAGQTTDAI